MGKPVFAIFMRHISHSLRAELEHNLDRQFHNCCQPAMRFDIVSNTVAQIVDASLSSTIRYLPSQIKLQPMSSTLWFQEQQTGMRVFGVLDGAVFRMVTVKNIKQSSVTSNRMQFFSSACHRMFRCLQQYHRHQHFDKTAWR